MNGLGSMKKPYTLDEAKRDAAPMEAAEEMKRKAGPLGKIITGNGGLGDMMDLITGSAEQKIGKRPSMGDYLKKK